MDTLHRLLWKCVLPISRAEVRGAATLLSSQYISTDVIDELLMSLWHGRLIRDYLYEDPVVV